METIVKNLENELGEVLVKSKNLDEFVLTTAFSGLSHEQQDLVLEQEVVLIQYKNILIKRLVEMGCYEDE